MNTEPVGLKKDKLRELPKMNEEALILLKDFASRKRLSFETDMDVYTMKLLHKGFKINPENLIKAWKELEASGAGVIVWGRAGNHNRFRWHYSLKDVGTEAIKPNDTSILVPLEESSKVTHMKPKRQYKRRAKRGRPVGSKNRTNVPRASKEVINGIVLTVKDVEGKVSSISLEEAVRISDQVSKLKELTRVA